VRRIQWPGQREQIRAISAMVALDLLRRALAKLAMDAPELLTRRAR
jgi:hypothetical protein